MLYRRQEDILTMSMDATIVVLNPIVGKSREKLKAQEENVLMCAVAAICSICSGPNMSASVLERLYAASDVPMQLVSKLK